MGSYQNMDMALGSITDILNNSNLIPDPWEIAVGDSRDEQFFYKDFRLTGKFPKGQIAQEENPLVRVTYGKANYLDEESFTVQIYYYSKDGFKYEVGGTSYKNESLIRYMLDLVRQKLKSDCGSFVTMHNMTFGSISNVVKIPDQAIYVAMLPMTVKWANT